MSVRQQRPESLPACSQPSECRVTPGSVLEPCRTQRFRLPLHKALPEPGKAPSSCMGTGEGWRREGIGAKQVRCRHSKLSTVPIRASPRCCRARCLPLRPAATSMLSSNSHCCACVLGSPSLLVICQECLNISRITGCSRGDWCSGCEVGEQVGSKEINH